MKRLFIPGLLSLTLLTQVGQATDAFYINNGTVTFPPQIDATNFINNGSFDFSLNPTVYPFDTSNTENFTNNGTMFGSVGFQFDTAPASGGTRRMAASFRNRLAGVITAPDVGQGLSQIDGQPIDTALLLPSYLLVSATNIHNEGTLTAGSAGILRLLGTNVNLARSGIQIAPIPALGSLNGLFTNYFTPDVGIYDYYWGQTNQEMNSSSIIRSGGGLIVSPVSDVFFFLGRGQAQIGFFNPVGDFYTNSFGSTNITFTNIDQSITMTNLALTNIVQAVFVGLPAGDVSWGVRFFDSTNPRNPFKTVSVGLSLNSTNVVSITPDQASIYLVDTLASETNRGFYTNFTSIGYLRPENYLLERPEPFEFAAGFPGNAQFTPDLLYKSDFATPIVTNEYAAYSAFVDNIASRPPSIPAGTVTNLPGRIEIIADSLDISRTRFRADGLLNIEAKHLVSSSNTLVDCENLSYTLGSTNGNLKIQSLAQEAVTRLKGYTYVWSGLWTNFENVVFTNYDTNMPPMPTVFSNVVEYRIYAMIYDASALLTQVPVIVNTLATHSTNVVINDHMTVVQSLLIDGQSFTLNGGITLSSTFFFDNRGNIVVVSLDSWIGTNTPNVKFFTNNGTINIPSEGHFGDDLPTPYSAFVNNGAITAFGQTINSDYLGISGQNVTSGELSITARTGTVEGGTLTAGGDIRLFANDLKFNRATVGTSSRLDLSVANSLSDSGGSSANTFSCSDGFRLLRKPATGDLLGTTVNTVAPAFAEVDHVWAASDVGAVPAGFQNNTALGRLTLAPGLNEANFPPLFFFAGTGGGNALYVDLLDLSKLADYQNEIQINPDLVIYFAAANLSFTPPPTNGVPLQPEEYLDGQFGGHLRWVKNFAGPNSSVAVIINDVSVLVNRGLRNSLLIDSDGDGIPNGLDPFPFNNPPFVAKLATQQPPLTAVLSWNGIAHKVYSVQAATNLLSPNWQTVMYYTNSASTNGTVTVQFPLPAGSARQFYRVGTTAP